MSRLMLKEGMRLSSMPLLLFIAAFSVVGSLLLLQTRADTGATYYVATDGSDANDGSVGAPWRTVKRSLSMLSAGDTLIVRGGTYNEQVQDPPIRKGLPHGRITVRAAPGERPVMAGLLWLTDADYWTLDGIHVTWGGDNTADQYMVKMTGGTGWRITNAEIWGAHSYAAVLVAGLPSSWSIDHNFIHDTHKSNGPDQDHLVYVSEGTGEGTVTRNILANSPNGRGVKIGSPSGGLGPVGRVTVSYNTFCNNTGPSNIQLSHQARDNTIFRNIMVKSAASNITAYNLDGSGNVAYDNVGWESDALVGADPGLADREGNIRDDPQLDPVTFKPGNGKYAEYGRYAPGDVAGDMPAVLQPAPAGTDSEAPAALAAVQLYARNAHAIGLSWAPSTDNVGVAGYMVYRDGALDGTRAGQVTDYVDTGLTANTTYSYQIAAYDAAGNVGARSAAVTLTTPVQAAAQYDADAPVVRIVAPEAAAPVSGQVSFEASATDNVGVARVEFWMDGARVAAVVAAPYRYVWNSAGLVGDHVLVVRAVDAAGNAQTARRLVAIDGETRAELPAPTGLKADAVGPGQINVQWDRMAADRVDIYRNGQLIGSTRAGSVYGDTYKIQPDRLYRYMIIARDTAGRSSAESAAVEVSTPGTSSAAGGFVTGRITDVNGAPVANARVSADIGGRSVTALSNARGVYTLLGIPAGAHQVTYAAAGYPVKTTQAVLTSGIFTIQHVTVGRQ